MAVEVTVTDLAVHIEVTGWDRIWTLSRGRIIPMAEIVSADVMSRSDAIHRIRWRLAGTHVPGSAIAGHFMCAGKDPVTGRRPRAWLAVFRDRELLRITLRGDRPRYVVIQHPGRHDLAWWIGERITAPH
jgi:hypothetical protein